MSDVTLQYKKPVTNKPIKQNQKTWKAKVKMINLWAKIVRMASHTIYNDTIRRYSP